jgi:hypothetical protein
MDKKKIDRSEIEAFIKGDKDLSQFLAMSPAEGIWTAFGVRTSATPELSPPRNV